MDFDRGWRGYRGLAEVDLETIRVIRVIRGQKVLSELIHGELSEDIIGGAMKVLNALKPGLDESIYENALIIELTRRGHQIDQQKPFYVYYESQLVGKLIPDMIVNNLVIVDPKVVVAFTDTHVAQMTGYLAATGLELAILLNFKFARLAWKRVVRSKTVEDF